MRRGPSPARLSIRRTVAAITAAWLVAFMVLGAHHEAKIAHVVDGRGQVHHAQLDRVHTGSTADFHAAEQDSDTDPCAIATALHQAARHERTRAAALDAPAIAIASIASARPAIAAGHLVFRIAPKTSPPIV